MRYILVFVTALMIVSIGIVNAQHTYVLPGYTPQEGVEDGWIPDAATPGLNGTASQTFVQTIQTAPVNWWSGIYDGTDYRWVNIEGDPEATSIYVRCDIEMYVKQVHDVNEIYFHIADNTTQMSAKINGSLHSNNGQWIGIEIPENKDIEKLVGTFDIFNRDISGEYIPVTWELREFLNGAWIPWRIADDIGYGNNGQDHAYWWLIADGEPCDHIYQFRCTINPAYHQPDGRYELDPAICVGPVL